MSVNDYDEEYLRLWNSYFYPGTETFKNKLGILDPLELHEKEKEISFEKLVELYENPIKGDFDKKHLCAIHHYLFSDLYDWAGQYRLVYMKKNVSYFASVDRIDIYLEEELKRMNEEIKYVQFEPNLAYFLAKYYVTLINIHPFREGNGRTIREFLRQFVLEKTPSLPCGAMELDFTKINAEKLEKAMAYSQIIRGPIEIEFLNALVPVTKEDEMKMWNK